MPWHFRVARLLQQELANTSALKLAEIINKENEAAKTGIRIDRRRLQVIARNTPDLKISIKELIALDVHYTPRGESLREKPVFDRLSILECVVECRKLTFLWGAKPRPRERRQDHSRWDTWSVASLQREANKFNVHLDPDFEDVLLRLPLEKDRLKEREWFRLLDKDERSVISIGSPLASFASEIMLARMFGVQPFVTPDEAAVRNPQLPFYFAWPPKSWDGRASSFALGWRELKWLDADQAARLRKDEIAAFVLGTKVHPVKLEGKEWDSYGVVVAQRRARGNVWLAILGSSGPATFATALHVVQAAVELPWEPRGRKGPVIWIPVRARLTTDKSRGDVDEIGEVRKVDPAGIHAMMDKPQVWRRPGPSAA